MQQIWPKHTLLRLVEASSYETQYNKLRLQCCPLNRLIHRHKVTLAIKDSELHLSSEVFLYFYINNHTRRIIHTLIKTRFCSLRNIVQNTMVVHQEVRPLGN